MARIYDAQIEWQAPNAHRFQAQPLKDYISNGLANVAQAAAQASEGVQKIHDQDAASKMKLAADAAQKYVNDFEDYSAENYMDVMEAGAMKIWDDAFGSLDEPTKRRFEQNNPEARNIFNLKIHEAATDKTFNHIYTEYDRRVPMMANEITALDDPNEIKAILEATVDSILNTSGMRAEDAEKIVDKLREEVSKGAINQMIGEGRLDDAAALTNDLQFSALISPSERAKFNTTIQTLLEAEKETKEKEPSASEKQKAIRDTVFEGTRSALSDAYDIARSQNKTSQWAKMYYKFLNDFQEGKLSDVYAMYDDDGNVIGTFTAAQLLGDDSFSLLTDMEYADRIDVAQKLLKAFETSPAVMREIGEITTNGGSLLDSLPRDDNGRVEVSKLTESQVGNIKEILDKTDENYTVMNPAVRDLYYELRRVYAAQQNLKRATLRPANYIAPDDVVELGGFFTSTENRASVAGQYTYSEMSKARSGPAVKQAGGTINDPNARETMLSALEPYWAYSNNGKRPPAGSNHMMVDMTMKMLLDADDETKKALGIYGYAENDIIAARDSIASNYRKFNTFEEGVDGKDALHSIRPTMPYDSPTKWDDMSVNERKAAYQMYTRGKFGNISLYTRYPKFVTEGTSGFLSDKKWNAYEKQIVADIEKGLAEDKNLYGNYSSAVDVLRAAATAGDRTASFGFDTSRAIEETDYYAALVGMIKRINPNAVPSASVVRNVASRIRSANYKDWLNVVGGWFDWNAGASKYAKGTQTRETADALSEITVKTTQGL